MTSDDDSRDSTTNAIRIKLSGSTAESVLDFCRRWAAVTWVNKSTAEAIRDFGKRMNEAAKKVAESHREAIEPLGVIFAKMNGEGQNFNRKPEWIDARQRRPPIPERRPLAVRNRGQLIDVLKGLKGSAS